MLRLFARSFSGRFATLVVVEHALIVLAVLLAAVVRLGVPDVPSAFAKDFVSRAVLVAAVLQVSFHYCDLYDLRTLVDRRDLFVGLLRALGVTLLILAMLYFWLPDLVIGRGVVGIASVLSIGLVATWRTAFHWLSLKGAPTERLLIVGTSPAALMLAQELFDRRSDLGVQIVGFVDTDRTKVGLPVINPGVIGVVADIPSIVAAHRVDRVVVSLPDARGNLNMNELLAMKLYQGVRFDHLASVYEQYTGKIALENLRPSWMIFSDGFRKSAFQALVKRSFDVVFSLAGLIAALPLMVVLMPVIRLLSPGPFFYSQQRVGKDGGLFTIHKFRSMNVDAEAMTGAVWSTIGDPRVTPIGRFLRRTRLDELPQLWNVLRGDMSFVGPRPERPEFVLALSRDIPYYGQRHAARPGLTGWAQIRHHYGSTTQDAQEKLQYDLFYVKHMSFAFDLFIVLETVKTVLVRPGS